jgi:GNAT superfamily N-acetyltransferase
LIELTTDPDERFWEIYDCSFPIEEREPRSVIVNAARSGVGRIARALDDGKTVGLASAHLLKDPRAIFLVYLAVDPARRGQGIGRALFDFIAADCPQVIWEVNRPELATDSAERQRRERRIGFFRRAGGEPLEHPYRQPPLGENLPPVPMLLMARPRPPDVTALVRAIYFEKYGAQNGIGAAALESLL